MPRYISKYQAARHFQTTERTIRNWIGRGYIKGYRTGPTTIVVDIDEIERMLQITPAAKDGRRTYGKNAKIVDLTNVVLAKDQR